MNVTLENSPPTVQSNSPTAHRIHLDRSRSAKACRLESEVEAAYSRVEAKDRRLQIFALRSCPIARWGPTRRQAALKLNTF